MPTYLIATLLGSLLSFFLLTTSLLGQEYRPGESNRRGEEGEENQNQPNANEARNTLGILRGNIIEAETGEQLISATVVLDSVQRGTNTDLDGNFTITRLKPGFYDIEVRYVGMAPVTLRNVQIRAGEVTFLNLKMQASDAELDPIVIETRLIPNTEASLLARQRNAPSVINGISAAEIDRNGDSNAATAIRRVSGVTVESGRYLYVRGLGDRYSKVMLQGTEVPSLDPERNAVQMDLFPANLIQNMVIHKTFAPDMPGNFSGGLLDISLEDFPDKFTLQFSSSVGYNTQATFNDNYLTYEGGRLDWLGMDDGTRARPDALRQNDNQVPEVSSTFGNLERSQLLNDITKGFSAEMAPTAEAAPVNHSHAFSIGDQKMLFGRPLGYLVSFSYRRSFQFYDNGRVGRWRLLGDVANTDELNAGFFLQDSRGDENVLWGGMATVSYKPARQHKLSLTYLYNQSGNSFARYQIGAFPDDDPSLTRENRVMGYTERSLSSIQMRGTHLFEQLKKLQVNWVSALTFASQQEPDLRFFSNDFTVGVRQDTIINEDNQQEIIEVPDTSYDIQENLYNPPSRFYRSYDEFNLDNRLHISYPVALPAGDMTLQAGGAYTVRQREFREDRYVYGINTAVTDYQGNPDRFFATENVGLVNPEQPGQYYLWIEDQTDRNNNYDGFQNITAAYAMADAPITQRLRVIGGVRYEGTDIEVETADEIAKVRGTVREDDFLPSLNMVYKLTERMNLRAAYTQTIARPTFRELAPFSSFNFIGDFILVGNPDSLTRTNVQNFDLRWEWFLSPTEIVSASLFYKDFSNPIERVLNPRATNPEIQFRNVDRATNYGLELEFRKHFGFISPQARYFNVGANLTLVYSEVDIAPDELERIRATNPDAESTRPMFSQSPYVVNARAGYDNPEIATNVNLVFNVFGPRIAGVTLGGTPNVFEQPRPSLDFIVRQGFLKEDRLTFRFRARNLLNPEYRLIHEFKGEEYEFSSYTIGRTFTVGLSYAIR